MNNWYDRSDYSSLVRGPGGLKSLIRSGFVMHSIVSPRRLGIAHLYSSMAGHVGWIEWRHPFGWVWVTRPNSMFPTGTGRGADRLGFGVTSLWSISVPTCASPSSEINPGGPATALHSLNAVTYGPYDFTLAPHLRDRLDRLTRSGRYR
jgi:hypothetical protein